MVDNETKLTVIVLDGVNRIPPGLLCQYEGYGRGILDRGHPEDPTPIQKKIEYAVTNGRGYLEKDQIRLDVVSYYLEQLGFELPTARDVENYARGDLPSARPIWLSDDIEYLPNGLCRNPSLKGVTDELWNAWHNRKGF
ncbi:MAG: hypothetical protein V1734_02190 [Nanoarchaeota archaeon]